MGTDAAFATLGVAVGAQPNEITRAFRAYCRACHPDHGGDRNGLERVVDAYRVLQRGGFVARSGPDARRASSRLSTPAIDYYRTLAEELDRVASIAVDAPPGRQQRQARDPRPRFADVLDAAVRRLAA